MHRRSIMRDVIGECVACYTIIGVVDFVIILRSMFRTAEGFG